ncbi:MAG TPA: FHA domain-containing protein, partial [Anaerolinea sp.]|nr:FHA domain-containing protein [Anaerolinea sp.]
MDHPGAELPILLAQSGPLDGQRWLLEHTIVVGRDPSCDLIINDRQISRYHARFEATVQGVFLEDLGSKNGTYYNGRLVEEPVLLKDGDVVQMALIQHFTFLTSDATMPLEGRLLPVGLPKSRLILDERSRRV